jgi:hypothetical protein
VEEKQNGTWVEMGYGVEDGIGHQVGLKGVLEGIKAAQHTHHTLPIGIVHFPSFFFSKSREKKKTASLVSSSLEA